MLGKPLAYDDVAGVRARMAETNPVFATLGAIARAPWAPFEEDGALDAAPFKFAVENFYMTDPIARASPTMARCTESLKRILDERTGTDG